MKNLYRFTLDCGRMGTITGTFTREPEQLENVMGKTVSFGEALGKHSNVTDVLKNEHFQIITNDIDFVKKFDEFKCASGYNPFDYLSE